MAMIHELIGKAMAEVGAIGKDSKNAQQGFMYRGIDAVYNALNPVMAKYGLFICPEVQDMHREERVNKNGTALIYTVLTVKYTIFAPDGSNVTITVMGEGMDTGDKSVNKAMSIAMKYAMFQLFFIPTEAVDPDSEVHEVKPKVTQRAVATKADVTKVAKLPEEPKPEPSPVTQFLIKSLTDMRVKRGISASENNKLFSDQKNALVAAGIVPDKKLEEYTMEEAKNLVGAMEKCFDLKGTELKTE